MHYKWLKKYGTGVQSVDEQHRHFFELASEAYEQSLAPTINPQEIRDTLDRLNTYVFYHFSIEEKYMETAKQSARKLHMDAHTAYRIRMRIYRDQARKAGVDMAVLAREITDFSTNWLGQHIQAMDKETVKPQH